MAFPPQYTYLLISPRLVTPFAFCLQGCIPLEMTFPSVCKTCALVSIGSEPYKSLSRQYSVHDGMTGRGSAEVPGMAVRSVPEDLLLQVQIKPIFEALPAVDYNVGKVEGGIEDQKGAVVMIFLFIVVEEG